MFSLVFIVLGSGLQQVTTGPRSLIIIIIIILQSPIYNYQK